MSFELLAEEGGARRGRLRTAHGLIDTPAFMPVGTQATVKALTPQEVHDLGAQVLLANTYHLALRPGAERIKSLGGLHRFMGWDGAILTDSGGFQVFSLDHLVKVSDDVAIFRSHLDGSEQRFTPESVMAIQRNLGSDIAMVFDQPVSWPATAETTRAAMERTHLWAARCLAAGGARPTAVRRLRCRRIEPGGTEVGHLSDAVPADRHPPARSPTLPDGGGHARRLDRGRRPRRRHVRLRTAHPDCPQRLDSDARRPHQPPQSPG